MANPNPAAGDPSRREFIKTAVGAAALLSHPTAKAAWAAGPHPVVAENANPGTSDWQLTYARFDAGGRSRAVEGYCSATSVKAGGAIDLFLSAAAETTATCDF